jgi:hypothetical protein
MPIYGWISFEQKVVIKRLLIINPVNNNTAVNLAIHIGQKPSVPFFINLKMVSPRRVLSKFIRRKLSHNK